MTREDIVRMAKEVGMESFDICVELDDFAALVASAAVRETSAEYRLGWNDGQIAEREACIKAIEDQIGWDMDDPESTAIKAIRAKGQA
jgi:hypothetical protein